MDFAAGTDHVVACADGLQAINAAAKKMAKHTL